MRSVHYWMSTGKFEVCPTHLTMEDVNYPRIIQHFDREVISPTTFVMYVLKNAQNMDIT
jgi:hypothetical protein